MKTGRRDFVVSCLGLLGLTSVLASKAQAKTPATKNCRSCKSFRANVDIDDDCGKRDLIDKSVSSRGWCEDFNKK